MANDERFLVTGALGCLGAWTVANLVREGTSVTAYDLGDDLARLRYLLDDDELAAVDFVKGDVTDLDSLERAAVDRGITHIIHLAALQVPFCKADPVRGAQVNVVGTVNVFDVARRQAGRIRRVVYASSAAVYGPQSGYPRSPVPSEAPLYPATHYGVYKQANEGTARIYWQDNGVTSIGLRPYVVYGVGRDQGLTSGATKAMLAAAADRPFHISHGGRMDFNYAEDVARAFVKCARAPCAGTSVHNVKGEGSHVDQLMAAIAAAAPAAAGKITYESGAILPFPEALDASSLAEVIGDVPYTPLVEGVRRTIEHFARLIEAGQIDLDRNLS